MLQVSKMKLIKLHCQTNKLEGYLYKKRVKSIRKQQTDLYWYLIINTKFRGHLMELAELLRVNTKKFIIRI